MTGKPEDDVVVGPEEPEDEDQYEFYWSLDVPGLTQADARLIHAARLELAPEDYVSAYGPDDGVEWLANAAGVAFFVRMIRAAQGRPRWFQASLQTVIRSNLDLAEDWLYRYGTDDPEDAAVINLLPGRWRVMGDDWERSDAEALAAVAAGLGYRPRLLDPAEWLVWEESRFMIGKHQVLLRRALRSGLLSPPDVESARTLLREVNGWLARTRPAAIERTLAMAVAEVWPRWARRVRAREDPIHRPEGDWEDDEPTWPPSWSVIIEGLSCKDADRLFDVLDAWPGDDVHRMSDPRDRLVEFMDATRVAREVRILDVAASQELGPDTAWQVAYWRHRASEWLAAHADEAFLRPGVGKRWEAPRDAPAVYHADWPMDADALLSHERATELVALAQGWGYRAFAVETHVWMPRSTPWEYVPLRRRAATKALRSGRLTPEEADVARRMRREISAWRRWTWPVRVGHAFDFWVRSPVLVRLGREED